MERLDEHSLILQPSEIKGAGVGCFASTDIAEGTRLSLSGVDSTRKLAEDQIPDSHLKYCPLLESGLYLAPKSFALMSVLWYVNHARQPNVKVDGWKLKAGKDIAAGQELTMYYPDLLTHPKNKLWVIPSEHI